MNFFFLGQNNPWTLETLCIYIYLIIHIVLLDILTSLWSFSNKTMIEESWSLIKVQKSTFVSGSGSCVVTYPTNCVYDYENK